MPYYDSPSMNPGYSSNSVAPPKEQSGSSAMSSLPMLSWFNVGGTQAQMAAEDVGTKTVYDKYALPYTYGAPSPILGMQSGQYAGSDIRRGYGARKEYTGAGKVIKTIGGLSSGFGGDSAGMAEGFSWMTDDGTNQKNQMYNQWSTNQMAMLQGKKGIYIKPSKRGSFTAWCKKNGYGGVTGECKSAGKNSDSPAIRKKATFAANASKWSKKR